MRGELGNEATPIRIFLCSGVLYMQRSVFSRAAFKEIMKIGLELKILRSEVQFSHIKQVSSC